MKEEISNILVSVIIPNWNGLGLIEECLDSLEKQSFRNFETIVVDNGSTDGSVKFIESHCLNVKILRNEKNHGFAKAVNQGIIWSKSKYVVLLNNDIRADKKYLEYLVKSITNKERICGVAPMVLDYFRPEIIDSAGDYMNILGQAFHRGHGEIADLWEESSPVFLISAGASIYKKKLFDEVGLFDETFFAYGEDVDWCLRAQILGCKFWYEPNAKVYHRQQATGSRIPRKLQYLQFRNMTLTIIKNFPLGLILKRLRFLYLPLMHLNTFVYMALNGYVKEAFHADLWILKNFFTVIKKRCKILGNRKVSVEYLDQNMEFKKLRFWGLIK